jgi:hypothetical protein
MTSQWTVQIPIFLTISGDSDLMNANQDVIQNKLKNMIETIMFESGTASARLEECISDYDITLHEMDVVTSEIITEVPID